MPLSFHAVSIQIVRFVDTSQPGWVEGVLQDAWGREWLFLDKVPILAGDKAHAHSAYPIKGSIACEVLRRWKDARGRDICTIDTSRPWGVEARSGETQFDVLLEQLTVAVKP